MMLKGAPATSASWIGSTFASFIPSKNPCRVVHFLASLGDPWQIWTTLSHCSDVIILLSEPGILNFHLGIELSFIESYCIVLNRVELYWIGLSQIESNRIVGNESEYP
mmetsp:Transcript_11199/g.23734  ORF Transcript_11199/g.23734 Transcript_11199/m.23734 type:complete len:108 (-) Transcript_11199:195-518(-)